MLFLVHAAVHPLQQFSMYVFHGPDPPEQLEEFALDVVIAEARFLALGLLCTLGKMRRNADDEQGLMTRQNGIVFSMKCMLHESC